MVFGCDREMITVLFDCDREKITVVSRIPSCWIFVVLCEIKLLVVM